MRFLRYFISFFFIPFWYLQLLISRKKDVWVFGAWNGQRYTDNAKVLYEYVLANSNEISPYWITKNREIYKSLIIEGKPCYLSNSLKGILTTLKAGIIIFSSGKGDINKFFINGAKIIQTWHGSPIKKIGLDNKYSTNFRLEHFKKRIFPFLSSYGFSACVSTGEAFNKYLQSAFDLKSHQILLTGYPRNDIFFSRDKECFLITDWNKRFNNPQKIIYLPTFRDNNPSFDLFSTYNFDANSWMDYLSSNNSILIIKGHYMENSINFQEDFPRIIKLLDEDVSDINFILKDVDLLITDYSGAYFDFALTGKPIILAPFDFETYISSSRELYFDYYKEFPNTKAQDWEEILLHIKNSSFYHKKLENSKYNYYQDGDNSQRLFKVIKELS